jgi:hypothetical protein
MIDATEAVDQFIAGYQREDLDLDRMLLLPSCVPSR